METDRLPGRDAPLKDEEVEFGLGELFFSRTDRRGVIQAGNAVFRRVSGYDWDALLGAPHKIVRHPDMPSGLFWLMWDRIKRGEPIGAYVKNRTEDGRYYWVFAVVAPIDDGYLSVRLKPTSPFLTMVQKEYAALRAREKAEGLSPEDSAAALLERLRELGFRSYLSFMSQALDSELNAQQERLKCDPPRALKGLRGLAEQIASLRDEAQALDAGFQAIQGIPLSMRIVASRLGGAGRPLGVIAENYRTMATDVRAALERYGESGTLSLDARIGEMRRVLFLVAGMQVMQMQSEQFAGEETGESRIDVAAERDRLWALQRRWQEDAAAVVESALAAVSGLAETGVELQRLAVGLDTVRVLCRVEQGRLEQPVSGLTSIIERLDQFHAEINQQLGRISDRASQIRGLSGSLRESIEGAGLGAGQDGMPMPRQLPAAKSDTAAAWDEDKARDRAVATKASPADSPKGGWRAA